MTTAGRVRSAGAGLLVLALAVACTTTAAPGAPRTPATVGPAWTGCEAVGAFREDGRTTPPTTGAVPPGFTPARVVLCEEGERTNAAGDTVSVDLERTSTDVAPLLTYLAQPDGRPTQAVCTADGWIPPRLFLVDADGRYVAPTIPVDGCSKPLGWRDHAGWTSLSYTDRVVREGEVSESAEAKASGCDMAYKDVVDAYATSSHRRPGGFAGDPFGGRPLKVCVFEVPEPDRGTDAPPGRFVSGRAIDDQERSTVVTALLATPETSPRCGRADARFASLAAPGGGPTLFVELDGCRRVVSDGEATPVTRAGDALVALLAG